MRLDRIALALVAWVPLAGGSGEPRTQDYAGSAAEATQAWAEWAEGGDDPKARDYEAEIVAGGRVLIWSSERSRASKLASTAKRVVAEFDALFATAARSAESPAPRTAVLVELDEQEDLAAVVELLAKRYEHLGPWAPEAARGVGFALEEPLAAGWLRNVPRNEVWSPENELANRLARLLTLERFGRLPHWLEMGLAWHFELDVCKDVFCFPYRSGFVSKKEHKSWDAQLAAAMRARSAGAISVEVLSGWPRGTWDEVRGPLAWGAAAMLARHYEKELPDLLAAYAAERRKEGRRVHPDGSWETLPDYETPPGRESELLDHALGTDFAAELTRFAKAPRSYGRKR